MSNLLPRRWTWFRYPNLNSQGLKAVGGPTLFHVGYGQDSPGPDKEVTSLIEAAPDLYQAATLLGGGDLYFEEFGRYCFCRACGFGHDKPWRKRFHATTCDDMNYAIFKAIGRVMPDWASDARLGE